MSLYRRAGSPFWWMSISIPGRPRFRGSTGETSEKRARLIEAETEQRLIAGRTPTDGWRLRDCLGAYWSDHAKDRAGASIIFTQLELLSVAIGADTRLADITNAMLMDYRARRRGGSIRVDDRAFRPVAAQTVNRDLAYLKAAMNWARDVHGQQIPALAWKRLAVSEPEHRIRFAGADEFARLIDAAAEPLRPIIVAAVTTGLRRANLRWGWHQVDLAGGTVTVPRSKGGKPLSVRITPALAAVIGRTPPAERRGPVFDWTNFRRRWQAAVKGAELADFRFHDLRHTFASWARMNGADIADICDALDHSSVALTMRYAHIQPGSRPTAFDRAAEMLAPPAPRRPRKTRA